MKPMLAAMGLTAVGSLVRQTCHAHISCSPVLSDVQISPNRSTFCRLRFAGVYQDFPALLTALLTECPCNLRKMSSTSIWSCHGVMSDFRQSSQRHFRKVEKCR